MGGWERIVAKFLGACFEQTARLVDEQRRQGIFTLAGRFEDVASPVLLSLHIAGGAANTELVFGFVVERFKFVVPHRPISQRGVLRNSGCAITLHRFRSSAEVILMHPP